MVVRVILTVKCTEIHSLIRERCDYLMEVSVNITVKCTEYTV